MSTREHVREIIRAELARQNPLEVARGTLELIAETSIRFVDDDPAGYRIFDRDGEPRTVIRNGVAAPFTISDLVAELRQTHPTLFEPDRGEAPGSAAEADEAIDSASGGERPAPAPEQVAKVAQDGLPDPNAEPVAAGADERAPSPDPDIPVAVEDVPPAVPEARPTLRRADEDVSSDPEAAADEPGRIRLPRVERDWITTKPLAPVLAAAEPTGLPNAERDWLLLRPAAATEPSGHEISGRDPATPAAAPAAGRDVQRATPSRPPQPEVRAVKRATSPVPEVSRAGRSRSYLAFGASAAVVAGTIALGLWGRAPETVSTAQSGAATTGRFDPDATGTVPPKAPMAEDTAVTTAAKPGTITGEAEVLDTATLRVDGKVVHLLGVEWARGGKAEDLTHYLGNREVVCEPAKADDVYRCEVDGRDLSEVVLYNGGGRATIGAPAPLLAAENRAKSERVGIWSK